MSRAQIALESPLHERRGRESFLAASRVCTQPEVKRSRPILSSQSGAKVKHFFEGAMPSSQPG